MDTILKVIFVALLATISLVTSTNITTQANTSSYLKEDIEVGLHDAVLHLDNTELSKGKIVFDQVKAKEVFIASFEKNTGLTNRDYFIKEFVFLDQSNSTFPTEYTSIVSTDIITIIDPTILAVVETKSNSYYMNNSSKTISRMASYSVKVTGNENSIDKVLAGNPNELGLVFPSYITRNITSPYGKRIDPFTFDEALHAGIDIASSDIENTPVVAAKSGTVAYAGWITGYGNIVIINHDNDMQTRYAHLNTYEVVVGQSVATGERIGLVGSTGDSTGPHLHYEIRIKGVPYDPLLFY